MKNRGLINILVIVALLAGGGAWWSVKHRAANASTNTTTATQTDPLATTYTYQGVTGQTALDLLKTYHKVETTQYSIGEFVTSIEGQTAPDGYFWEFVLNGTPATVGAGSYTTQATDTILWRLTKVTM